MDRAKPLVLLILDGWGIGEEYPGNAQCQAAIPNYRRLWREYPHTVLEASGEEVGLPAGQMGNSEVGHLNIGAGRVVYQELTRITKAIREGVFFANPVFNGLIEEVRKRGGALHLLGLLSDGGVHSHIDHLFALLDLAKARGLTRVYIHALLDGRDVPPASALGYIDALENKLMQIGLGQIATVMGRYYGMDRDRRWERTARAYRAMVSGEGEKAASAKEAVDASYRREVTDEFMEPAVITGADSQPIGLVRPGDGIIFFNFRADRARQITRAFVDEDCPALDRPGGRLSISFACMTQYDATIPAPVAFLPQELNNTLGEVLALHELRQLRLAETEKYAHVTFFLNGGVERPYPGEDRILIPSPKVATYDLQPEMSARGVTDTAVAKIQEGIYDVIIMNYANPDMVGHTGFLDAAVKALETIDECLGIVEKAVGEARGTLVVTGDHGNVEQMVDPGTGEPHTAHTNSKVPFILADPRWQGRSLRPAGALEDVAPTVLHLLGIEPPPEMTGKSLLL
ncbi:MAG: 2,3-bisphosphoglycerate-independent phosphoglycerate mutase [Bacillota bacterium]